MDEVQGYVIIEDDGSAIEVSDFTAYIHPAEEGGYWADVPQFPGCVTEGDTLDEVVANLNEAVSGWLSVQTRASLDALKINYKVLSRNASSPTDEKDNFTHAHLPIVRKLEFAA